jgi:hypothetical protein
MPKSINYYRKSYTGIPSSGNLYCLVFMLKAELRRFFCELELRGAGNEFGGVLTRLSQWSPLCQKST